MMPNLDSLDLLLCRVQAGDQAALPVLVQRLRPLLLRTARARMRRRGDGGRLRVHASPSDICQSVLVRLLQELSDGTWVVKESGDAKRILITMVTDKLAGKGRLAAVQRRKSLDDARPQGLIDSAPSAENALVERDLADAARERFKGNELAIWTRKWDGATWVEIAAEVRRNPDAVRKQAARALDRVRDELNAKDAEDAEGL